MLRLSIITLILGISTAHFYIDDFGAIPHSDTLHAQFTNQKALQKAIAAANMSSTDKTVVIPKNTYYFMPVHIEHVNNLNLVIRGKVIASKNVRNWPFKIPNDTFWEFLTFYYSHNLTISGGGKIDGRGYHWWILCLLNDKKYLPNESARPHLIHLYRCKNTSIHDLILKNSPQFHIKMDDCLGAEIYNLNIRVNTTAQLNLIKHFSLEGTIPMFPFNTDGIDPHGSNMHIYNLTIQNWDDVVVPKPGSKSDLYDDCTQNYLVENCTVILGVGMSIGSIAPSHDYHCIKNVTFRNVHMEHPWKGIYIKSNPGDEGSAIVSNIVYENFTMIGPRWWAVYIGPQQMKQPDGDGPGCMIYPLDPKGKCITQPLVTIQNITLRNIAIKDSLLYPITIRCNVSNPCRYFVFQNVTTNKWRFGQLQTGVVCEYVTGYQRDTSPQIPCFYEGLNFDQTFEPPHQKSPSPTSKQMWEALFQADRLHPYYDEDSDDMELAYAYQDE